MRNLRGDCLNFVGPHLEQLQGVGTKSHADGDVRGISSARNQHAADAPLIVARVKDAPVASDIGFEPTGEVHGGVHGRYADVPEVAGAVASGDVQAAAQGERQMRVIAAHAPPFIESLPRGLGGAGALIVKGNVLMHEIANGLHPRPSSWSLAKRSPGEIKQLGIAIAVAAGHEKRQRFHWRLANVELRRLGCVKRLVRQDPE